MTLIIIFYIKKPKASKGHDFSAHCLLPLIFINIMETNSKNPKRKQVEEALRKALEESQQRQAEISALLEGTRAVLKYREFKDAARSVFNSCKNLIGATSGYVALLSEDGTENAVLFLESGGRVCTVDPSLPMPIRGLRGESYRTGKVVYENDFPNSEWMKFMPKGHVTLDNVLFAPLLIDGNAVGLMGIANKPGGFTDDDARRAAAFGELAAIALLNSRTMELLEHSEERFRSVAESAGDAVITADSSGSIVSWNKAAETMFGYTAEEAVGMPLTQIMPERFREAHQKGIQRVVATGKKNLIGKLVEVLGLRKDGQEFPIEISLATWQTGEEIFFAGICRDITERKRAGEEIKRLNEELEQRVKELEAFSYSVSHDLRAPLRSIDGFSQALLEDYADGLGEQGKDFLHRVRAASQHMGGLIDDLLKLSRISRSEMRHEAVNLSEVVKEIASGLQKREAGRIVEFVIEKDVIVKGDRMLLTIMMENLLGNAWKFTDRHPRARVEFGAAEQDGKRVYFVRDDGAGFDMAYVNKLFVPFQRLHTPAEFPGTGIGLSTVQHIIYRHGGKVWAKGEVENGATFYFTLPL